MGKRRGEAMIMDDHRDICGRPLNQLSIKKQNGKDYNVQFKSKNYIGERALLNFEKKDIFQDCK